MKSYRHGTVAANAKLRGKVSVVLSCRCCDLVNFRPRERWKEAAAEIKRFKQFKGA